MKKTEQKALKFIDGNSLIEKGDKIIVALSGGPDSVFLLHLLYKYKKRFSISIAAFHLNHLLRGKEASRDETFCRNLCLSMGIPFYSVRKNVRKYSANKKISVEEAGRELRYSLLASVLKKNGYNKIATAHNSDDNTETVLLNLIKGTGLKGISGIPIIRGNIIRPVLILTKKEILSYLQQAGLNFVIDLTNESVDYERNFIRIELLPLIRKKLNPSVESALFNSSRNFRNIYTYLLNKTRQDFKGISFNDSELRVPLETLVKQEEGMLTFFLKELLERNFSQNLTFNDFTSLKNLISKQTGRKLNLSSGLIVYKERKEIIICRNSPSADKKMDYIEISAGQKKSFSGYTLSIKQVESGKISPGKDKTCEFISADDIFSDKFIIRTWQSGDRFIPIGMNGSKKVSDFLNEIKMESNKKKDQFLLLNGKKIVWVIGKRLDDRFKINKDTKKVLELCLKTE